jgi:mono/diheme cytochrome c family protein
VKKFLQGSVWLLAAMGMACSDDSPSDEGDDATVPDAARPDASFSIDAGPDGSIDAALPDATGPDATLPDAGPSLAQRIERGRYIVENVAPCADCHTPRGEGGAFDQTRRLSGVDCFVDADRENENFGCLSSRNLTNHETGLKNRSDAEIKDLFMKGMRPDGTALHPIMPYYVLGNMTSSDADAVVAYLRTLPGVDHQVKATQPPFNNVTSPAPIWPDSMIPKPREDYPQKAAALRGRYLAGSIGTCMECHTIQENDAPVFERAFEGSRAFPREMLGLGAPWPEVIYASNITPDATGVGAYDIAKLVRAIKQGVDEEDKPICPPMPSGAMSAFAGLTDADATDIAHYLLSIPAKVNTPPLQCDVPAGP